MTEITNSDLQNAGSLHAMRQNRTKLFFRTESCFIGLHLCTSIIFFRGFKSMLLGYPCLVAVKVDSSGRWPAFFLYCWNKAAETHRCGHGEGKEGEITHQNNRNSKKVDDCCLNILELGRIADLNSRRLFLRIFYHIRYAYSYVCMPFLI